MKNLGLADWAVVELGTHDFTTARRVAVHAEELLDRPRVARTLDEAVADCAWVVGTTPRRVRGRRTLSPQEVAAEVMARAPARTAIVFGEERSGLTNEEALRCHDLSAIPADPEQPSLNLAQAVLLYAWEVRKASIAHADPLPLPRARGGAGQGEGAVDRDLSEIEQLLREVLRESGYLAGPERHAVRDLADVLRRARLTKREVRLWTAALRTLGKKR
jgi:tRNA/rRNA methyltransferase